MATNEPASNGAQGKPFKPALLLILLLPVAVLMAPTAIVVLAALMPTYAARLIDNSRGHFLTYTILGLNIVGALWFLHELWAIGEGFGVIAVVLGDPIGWLCVFAGAGFGWLLYLGMPYVTARMAETQTALRLRRVRRDLEQLTQEWGPGVSGGR
jgi:hypothetical protein